MKKKVSKTKPKKDADVSFRDSEANKSSYEWAAERVGEETVAAWMRKTLLAEVKRLKAADN